MEHTHEVEQMCVVAKGAKNGPAPIPQEGKWTQVKEVKDISGLTHGIGLYDVGHWTIVARADYS